MAYGAKMEWPWVTNGTALLGSLPWLHHFKQTHRCWFCGKLESPLVTTYTQPKLFVEWSGYQQQSSCGRVATRYDNKTWILQLFSGSMGKIRASTPLDELRRTNFRSVAHWSQIPRKAQAQKILGSFPASEMCGSDSLPISELKCLSQSNRLISCCWLYPHDCWIQYQ